MKFVNFQMRRHYRNLKTKMITYMGGKCKSCGYSQSERSLVFHHRDPQEKDFTVSGKYWSWERILPELEKCDLLCQNCHVRVHNENSKESYDEIMKMRSEGVSYTEIGKELGIHRNNVKKREIKCKLVSLKGSKCEICGWGEFPFMLEFHHRDPKEKEFNISLSSKSLEKTLKEVEKCNLLCKNCHCEIHEQWENEIFEKEKEMWKDRVKGKIDPLPMKECEKCLKEFKAKIRNQKYCSQFCAHEGRAKIDWPSKEELEGLLQESNPFSVGKKLGVSCNAVRKHCRRLGIDYTK